MTPTREQIECPHDQLQSWHFEDGSGPAGMWSCKACGLKFVPITETAAARAQALEDAAGVCDEQAKRWPNNAAKAYVAHECARAVEALKGKQ